jgi:hypothetical protein
MMMQELKIDHGLTDVHGVVLRPDHAGGEAAAAGVAGDVVRTVAPPRVCRTMAC